MLGSPHLLLSRRKPTNLEGTLKFVSKVDFRPWITYWGTLDRRGDVCDPVLGKVAGKSGLACEEGLRQRLDRPSKGRRGHVAQLQNLRRERISIFQ